MTSRFRFLLLALTLGPLPPIHAAEPDVPTLLQTADRYRTGSSNLQVDTLVTTLNRDGSPDKERRYTVFVQDQHRSLVLMRSPAEAGQKVLMLGDDFWLLMPNSQRPLRITPTQKLLGDASTGDIATLNWSEDYDGTRIGEEPCDADAPQPRPCLHLSLSARRKGVSYQRIELWLGKTRHEPVRADLYVQSEKLAKQARFVLNKAGTEVDEMHLRDQLSSHKLTRIQYLARKGRQVPETWLNPMFLVRNPSVE
jgi:Outer membrane lipoprotein-sorting protein